VRVSTQLQYVLSMKLGNNVEESMREACWNTGTECLIVETMLLFSVTDIPIDHFSRRDQDASDRDRQRYKNQLDVTGSEKGALEKLRIQLTEQVINEG